MLIAGESFATRTFRAGSLEFAVRCSSAALRGLVEVLFNDLDSGTSGAERREIALIEEVEHGSPMVRLEGASWPGPPSAPADIAIDLLVGAVNQLALDAEPDEVHIHAGVVERSGECVVLAASSGTGKSVLTAELVHRGWGYLTDETAAFPIDGRTVTGFPKPLTVKRGARSLAPHLADLAVSIESSERTSWQVPASRLGTLAPEVVEPRLVVVLDRDRGRVPEAPRWSTLEPADAAARLLQVALDAGRYGPDAMLAVANLAGGCRTVEIDVGAPQATAELVEALFEEGPSNPVEAHRVEASASGGLLSGLRVPPSTSTVLLGGRAVVHDTVSCRVAAFDDMGTEVWLALHGVGDATTATGADEVQATPFVQTLRAEGFLVDDPAEVGAS